MPLALDHSLTRLRDTLLALHREHGEQIYADRRRFLAFVGDALGRELEEHRSLVSVLAVLVENGMSLRLRFGPAADESYGLLAQEIDRLVRHHAIAREYADAAVHLLATVLAGCRAGATVHKREGSAQGKSVFGDSLAVVEPPPQANHATRDRTKLKALLTKASEGDPQAQYEIGILLTKGEGVRQDIATAAGWLKKAATAGIVDAQFVLGALYQKGRGVPLDPAQAVAWYRKAADQGDAASQFNLGYCYETGEGVEPDLNEALNWYSKASAQGDEDARQAYEDLKAQAGQAAKPAPAPAKSQPAPIDPEPRPQRPISFQPQPELATPAPATATHAATPAAALPESEEELHQLAEAGDAAAQLKLGLRYATGEGAEQNDAMAAHWVRAAAEQGHPDAEFALGVFYHRGQGVTQDFSEAVRWYERAARNGNSTAQFNLGYCYEIGEGFPKDAAQAIYWYQRAAAQGDADAKIALRELGVQERPRAAENP